MSTVRLGLLLAAMLAVVTSQASMPEVLAQDSRFTTFNKLLQSSELLSSFTSEENTLLAPTDVALDKLGPDAISQLFNDSSRRDSFLWSYLVPGLALPDKSQFSNMSLTSMDGSVSWIVNYPLRGITLLNGAPVNLDDAIRTSQGVILPVNDAIHFGKESAYEFLSSHPNFTNFLTAVQLAGKVDELKAPGITVFLPTDDAFAHLEQTHQVSSFTDIPFLREVVGQHVIMGVYYRRSLAPNIVLHATDAAQMPLHIGVHQGHSTYIRVFHDLVDHVDSREYDIPVTNGVIHIVNHVIMSRPQFREKSTLVG